MSFRSLCQTYFFNWNKIFKGLAVLLLLLLGVSASAQTITIGPNVSNSEGNSGTTVFSFTVSHTGNVLNPPTAKYTVSGSGLTPADDADFVGVTFPSGEVTFPLILNNTTITINVNGDLLIEPDETFTVTLSDPTTGYTFGNDTAIGTITNDDSCAAGTTAPVLDSSVPTAYCNIVNRDLDDFTNSPVPPNSVLVWSTNSNPLIVADHLVGSIATTAGTYYGFFYDSLNNCASSTLQVTLTLNTSPFAGPDVNVAACNSTDMGGSTTLDLDLQLTGEDPGGTWTVTTDPSGGMTIGAGNVVNFAGLPVSSVYVFTYTTNNAIAPCVNDTATVTVTVTDCTCPAGNATPVLDSTVPTAFCDAIAQDLNEYTNSVPPAGTALTWSTNPDPKVINAHIPSNVSSAGTYYGFFYDSTNNCGSPVLTVTLTINPTPKILTTTPRARCGTGTVTLGATSTAGSVLNWYSSETGGTFLGTGTSFLTPSIAATTSFWVEATANGCTSMRTAVVATINTTPTINGTAPGSTCGPGPVTLGATGSSGSTLNWYANATGGTSLGTGTSFTTPSINATRNYYVEATANGCSSGRTAVVATVNALPTVNDVTPAAICGPGVVVLRATGSPGSTLNWYAAATGGVSLGTGVNFTRNVNVTTTYYVEAVALTCISVARTPVTATVNPQPFAGPDVNVAACNSTDTGGSTTLDLDDQLTGEDPGGTWTVTTDPSGGMTIGAGNVVNFAGLPVSSVYVFTYTTNNAIAPCVNDTATVTVTVTDCTCPAGNVAPVLDTSVPTAFCDIIAQDLNEYTNSVPPAGTALTWSTNPDPTVANAHIFSNVDAPGTYYGFFYDAVDNCGSPVLTVNLTINTTPEVLTTIPGSRCGIGTVTLGGTRDPGAVLNWWDSETGGTFLGTGTSFVTPSIAETTTFYVEATANGCTSERTAVIATVYEQPNPGVANNTSACSLAEGFTTIDLNTRLVGADPGVWTITSVPTGSTVTIGPNNIVDFVGQPDGDYIFTYTTNTAQAPCTDPSTTLTVSVSPSDCAPNDIDLELVKQVDKGSVDVGGQVTFTLALTNLSDIQATNIIVSDPLGISYGFPYVASTPSKGTYNNITGEWAIDVLEPHESISLILVASVPVEGTFTNMAMITASFPNDGNPANNESSVEVEVLSTVCLQIFNQISPNGDGINDEFIINCIRNYKNNKLEIFDRYGNKVFSKTNYDNTWSGTGKNGDLPKGTYFYSLDLGDGSAGKTGWIQIIR